LTPDIRGNVPLNSVLTQAGRLGLARAVVGNVALRKSGNQNPRIEAALRVVDVPSGRVQGEIRKQWTLQGDSIQEGALELASLIVPQLDRFMGEFGKRTPAADRRFIEPQPRLPLRTLGHGAFALGNNGQDRRRPKRLLFFKRPAIDSFPRAVPTHHSWKRGDHSGHQGATFLCPLGRTRKISSRALQIRSGHQRDHGSRRNQGPDGWGGWTISRNFGRNPPQGRSNRSCGGILPRFPHPHHFIQSFRMRGNR